MAGHLGHPGSHHSDIRRPPAAGNLICHWPSDWKYIKWPYSICSPGHPCSCIKMEKETGSGSSVYSGCRMYCRICPLQLLLLHFKACRCEKEIINHRGLYQPGAVAKQMRNHLWSKGSSFMSKNRKRTQKSP